MFERDKFGAEVEGFNCGKKVGSSSKCEKLIGYNGKTRSYPVENGSDSS